VQKQFGLKRDARSRPRCFTRRTHLAITSPPALTSLPTGCLVTADAYDAAGNVDVVTDPRGIQSLYTFDMLGRQTVVVLGHTVSSTPVASIDQTTDYSYDANGYLLTLTADNPSSVNQTTQYVYGVGTTALTDLFSNDLIQKVKYPDPSTGDPSSSASDQVSYTYDLQGENTSKTDQNGNVHAYSYDVLGHLTLDAVTTLGSGVDGSIRALGYTYTAMGLPFQQTSYSNSAGTTVVNQVEDVYNGFGQLTKEYQEHSGAVNTGSSLYVGYDYDSTGTNDSRLTAMIYPNGRQLDYVYNSGLDSDISRISALADDGGSDAGTIQSYTYLGLSTIVQTTDGNGITLTYIQQTGDTLAGGAGADGGDRYIGLDEFGRVVDQNYINSSGTSVDRFQYAYDADGNVLYKNNLLSSYGTTLYHPDSTASGDDASAYDALNRLTYYVSGSALSASGHNGSFLDTTGGATGTALSYDALGNATAVGSGSFTYNAQNQISGSGAPTYDNNGNTTLEAGSTYVYDGWNRLVNINSGVESYVYDAQGRRIYESQDGENRYYDSAGQVIQETGAAAQYVWGLGYVNDLVLRDDGYFGGGSLGKTSSGYGERLYVEQDADWDVTSLSDDSGNIVQHIIYNDPFGNNVSGVTGDWSTYEGFYSSPYFFAFGFQGGRYDFFTGLWQFGVREYDSSSAAGRWMQAEPFGAFYVNGPNLYQFEGGNSVASVDPTGLAFQRPYWWSKWYRTSGAKNMGKDPTACPCGDCDCLRKETARNALALAVRTIDSYFYDTPQGGHDPDIVTLRDRVAEGLRRINSECGGGPTTQPSPTPVPWPLPTAPPQTPGIQYQPQPIQGPVLPTPKPLPVIGAPQYPWYCFGGYPWWAGGGRTATVWIDRGATTARVVSCACFVAAGAGPLGGTGAAGGGAAGSEVGGVLVGAP